MKTIYWIILAFTFIQPFNYIYANDYRNEFTKYKINDTIPIIEHNDNYVGHCYFFINANSCFTCLLSLNSYYQTIEKNNNIEFIVFFKGGNQEYIDKLKKQNHWEFTILWDPAGAYMKLYKVNILPFFFLTNKDGKIILMDKCAGVKTSMDDIHKQIENLKYHTITNHAIINNNLIPLRRILIKEKSKPIIPGPSQYFLYSNLSNQYVLLIPQNYKYFISDSTGQIIDEINLRDYKDFYSLSPFPPIWVKKDSVILGVDMTQNADRIIYYLNIKSHKMKMINFKKPKQLKNFDLLWFFNYIQKYKRILVGYLPLQKLNRKLNKDSKINLLIDGKGNVIKLFGQPDSIFINFRMSSSLRTKFSSDINGDIYENQSPSRKINIYNANGERIKSFYFDFDTTWRNFGEDINVKGSRKYWEKVNENMSIMESLFVSKNGDTINVVYRNYSQKIDNYNNKFDYFERYLHRSTKNGKRIDNHDILLPQNNIPFYINGDTIICSEKSNDKLYIVWYKIKK